jgi:hypothetical protein
MSLAVSIYTFSRAIKCVLWLQIGTGALLSIPFQNQLSLARSPKKIAIAMIKSTPSAAPFPVEKFFKLSSREQAVSSWNCSRDATALPCNVPVKIGLFFDGTNNNLKRDRDGERVSIGGKDVINSGMRLPASECSHSNVARLFEVFQSDRDKGIFSYYIPGVGTRFSEIGEMTETSEGKAFAKGGQARIIYALLQVINSIYGMVMNKPLYSDNRLGAIAQAYDRSISPRQKESNNANVSAHVDFFDEYIGALTQAIRSIPKPVIPSVTLNVFGFSRGAAEAVAFCHMFDELLIRSRFASIPASINFLGIFDTVASVGVSASVSMTTILPKAWADGHYSWASRILKPLPPSVRSGRHYIAAHEQRMNFPVTTQTGASNFKEVYFPGVHSDVGGGYGPGEGGKGRGHQAAMLSQIPLAYMYKEACIEGVPFMPYEEFEEVFKEDFSISSELAASWEAYCKELEIREKEYGDRLRAQMGLYYYWRAARLETLEQTEFFKSASKQEQQDLLESNQVLKGDLSIAKARATVRFPGDPETVITAEEAKSISQWHVIRANQTLESWGKWALSCFTKPQRLSEEVMRFFDNYVHDSIAGFYLAGEVTEYDKRVKVASVMKARPEKMGRFDKRIFELTTQVNEAVAKKKRGEELTQAEAALVEEAEAGTPFPVMTDDDAADMRSAAIKTQTSSRREGGGYLLKRGFHPKDDEGNRGALISDAAGNAPNSPGKAAA